MKSRRSLLLALTSSAALFILSDVQRKSSGSAALAAEVRMASSRSESERAGAAAETALARALGGKRSPAATQWTEDEEEDWIASEILEDLAGQDSSEESCCDGESDISGMPAVCVCAQAERENARSKAPGTVTAGDLHPLQKSCSVLKTSSLASLQSSEVAGITRAKGAQR